jgi:hypothetical protein
MIYLISNKLGHQARKRPGLRAGGGSGGNNYYVSHYPMFSAFSTNMIS